MTLPHPNISAAAAARTAVNIGAAANDNTGDPLRIAFTRSNARDAGLELAVDQAKVNFDNLDGRTTTVEGSAMFLTPRGAWATATQYVFTLGVRRDYFIGPDGTAYITLLTHTSTSIAADLAAGRIGNIDSVQLRGDLAGSGVGQGAEMVAVRQSGSPFARTMAARVRDFVTPFDFGAIADGASHPLSGVTSFSGLNTTGWTLAQWQALFSHVTALDDELDWVATQAALNASRHVEGFDGGTFVINRPLTKAADHVCVRLGSGRFINAGTGFVFDFGSLSDDPVHTGLTVSGGHFEQATPTTTDNLNFLRVRGVQGFDVSIGTMRNVSNGGLYIGTGCSDGRVSVRSLVGRTQYSTIRGIWLDGSEASDFESQLLDLTSVTRNASALPAHGVKRVSVVDSVVSDVAYGVYLMNAHDCKVDRCSIDISGSGANRCVVVNNYSPGARVSHCTLRSDRSSTGVLVTQSSDRVVIFNNDFLGDFGGGRAVYVQMLASAKIKANNFHCEGTQAIQVNMGGVAHITDGNDFTRAAKVNDHRAVYVTPLDEATAGTGTIGDTATALGEVTFEGNIVDKRALGVLVNTTAFPSAAGNRPSIGSVMVRNNLFKSMNLASTASEYPLLILSGTSANITNWVYDDNKVFPASAAARNTASVSGGSVYSDTLQTDVAHFTVNAPAAGGTVTSTKVAGANFSCAASRSGNDILISPRTIAGASGASVAVPFGVVDLGGNVYRFSVRRISSNYLISAFDAAGTQITLSTVAASFSVLIGAVAGT